MPSKDNARTGLAPNIKQGALVSTTLFVLVLAVIVIGLNQKNNSKCGSYRNDKTVTINGYRIKTEQASNSRQLEKGLGGRKCIESNRGMLFVFDHQGTYAIWMKDMQFPIDIAWIGQDHKVVGIEKNINPSTYPDRFVNRDKPAKYVLELQANKANAIKLQLNDQVSF